MLKILNINKYFFKNKSNQIHAIDNTSLEISEKGLVALLGESGSGKTTLLNVISGLDNFDSGTIYYDNKKITKHSINKMEKIRNLKIGYVFQDYKLIEDKTVYENVEISLKLLGLKDKDKIEEKVNYVLNILDIYRYRKKPVSMLSGGERQRVGIARAIVKNPDIIICDEPTGNLDSKNSVEIMNIIKAISKKKCVILVTHEVELANFYADRIIKLKNGKIISDEQNKSGGVLNYQIDNKIYLKDLPVKEYFVSKNEQNLIEYFSDSPEELYLKIVLKNNNLYIESNKHIEEINENSSYELIDDHYKQIDDSVFDKYTFDIKDDYEKKYSSIYSPISMITYGIDKLRKGKLIKKLSVAIFVFAGIFVAYSLSCIIGQTTINKSDYLSTYEKYYMVKTSKEPVKIYQKLKNDDNIESIIPGDSTIYLLFEYNEFYQATEQDIMMLGSAVDKNFLNEKDIIYGRMPENENEIVIDSSVITNHKSLNIDCNFETFGYKNDEDYIGLKTKKYNGESLTIVGISNIESPSIFVDSSKITQLIKNDDYSTIHSYDDVKNDIMIVSGRIPENDYEVILNINEYSQNNVPTDLEKINNNSLKIVGYFNSSSVDGLVVNKETNEYYIVEDAKEMLVIAKDNNKLKEDVGSDAVVHNVAESEKITYEREKKESLSGTITMAIVMMIVAIIEVFFITRASFLSRIKEIGTLRAIGVKKLDIYKMFAGETIVISVLGAGCGSFLIYEIMDAMKEIISGYYSSPLLIVYTTILVTIVNVFFALIPVYTTIRKSPAKILSRRDA